MPIVEQARACQEFLRRPVSDAQLERAQASARRRGTLGNVLVRTIDRPSQYGFTTLRAVYADGVVEIYQPALEEVEEAARALNFALEVAARDVVLAHETFHVVAPECVDEIAAHFFATQSLGISWYAGLIDPLTLIHRRLMRVTPQP
ncbi:MAG: hypothetical protein FJX76_02285 [Armatimonadetes bacterium]|nr:hypothetical protein [Armatimonadota bacterium]